MTMETSIAADQLKSIVERIERDELRVFDLINLFEFWGEKWRKIEDWPEYEVSSWGNVRRGDDLLQQGDVHGYRNVNLSKGETRKTFRVHRLVAEAFLGPAPFDGAMVAHNDGNKTNNRISNLRWASALENQADSIRHGTRPKGSEVKLSKLTESAIPEIRKRAEAGERYASIAKDYGVSVSTISLIKKGRIWGHV
jgi:hypothetical protein